MPTILIAISPHFGVLSSAGKQEIEMKGKNVSREDSKLLLLPGGMNTDSETTRKSIFKTPLKLIRYFTKILDNYRMNVQKLTFYTSNNELG